MAKAPTTDHSVSARPDLMRAETDGRMYSAAYEKNVQPVIDGLLPFLAGRTGHALEIGSGTGQHILAFAAAFADLDWTPSEPDPARRASIEAWRQFRDATTRPTVDLNAAADWATQPAVQAITPLQLIVCLNVIHISPARVLHGILHGATQSLAPRGLLAFYGPFVEQGRHTGQGNVEFDAYLRADNPEWGLRDVDDVRADATTCGLGFVAFIEMPSNNRLLILEKPDVSDR